LGEGLKPGICHSLGTENPADAGFLIGDCPHRYRNLIDLHTAPWRLSPVRIKNGNYLTDSLYCEA